MTGRRPKTTRYKLSLTVYKGNNEGESIKLTVKCSNVKQAMFEASYRLEMKGFDRIRLEEAKIGKIVIYKNEDKS